MKIGILTFYSAHNFGATLQAYAMQSYLEGKGHKAEIINYRLPSIDYSYALVKKPKLSKNAKIHSKYLKIIRFYLRCLKKAIQKPYAVIRIRRFERFFTKYFHATKIYRNTKQLRKATFDYDVIIAGSDQIWNSGITKTLDPAFFVDFASPTTIKASYAASYGNKLIPEKEKLLFKNYLRQLDYISVREQSAKDEIAQLTRKEVTVTLDPTLLVNRELFDNIKKNVAPKQDYIYIHVHHHTAKALDLRKVGEEVSKRTGLPVIHNIQGYKFKNELKKALGAGPLETLGYISGAKYVITQSFHATVFAILYKKNFLTLKREKYSERFEHLLENLELSAHLITDFDNPPSFDEIEIDYERVYYLLAEKRKESFEFIDKVLSGRKAPKEPDYFESGNKFNCFGCSLCKDICPQGAITMTADDEGFLFPYVNKTLCNKCNLCKINCIYNTKRFNKHNNPKLFAAINTDKKDREKSTSGGIFPLLYRYVLSHNGCVVGVRYNENMEAMYDISESLEGCDAFRGSKYVIPQHNDIFLRTKQQLLNGREVLFVGLPCKIAALKNYLKKDYDNLYLVELICSRGASPKVLKKYIECIEREYNSKVTGIDFRNKIYGWKAMTVKITFENGKILYQKGRQNPFFNAYLDGNTAALCCFNCEFTGDNKLSDMTIGDFWGIQNVCPELNDDKGISAIKANTEKGHFLFNQIKDSLEYKEVTYKNVYDYNHNRPADLKPQREELFSRLDAEEDTVKLLSLFQKKIHKAKK